MFLVIVHMETTKGRRRAVIAEVVVAMGRVMEGTKSFR